MQGKAATREIVVKQESKQKKNSKVFGNRATYKGPMITKYPLYPKLVGHGVADKLFFGSRDGKRSGNKRLIT